jgi:Plasmid encoded RepA protein
MQKLSEQLEIFGVNEVVRRIEMEPVRPSERRRLLRRVEVTYDMMTELPVAEDLSFLHSGLCQTCLPHSRPPDDRDVWRRSSGRFSLIITPGVVDDSNLSGPGSLAAPGVRYVGVPYGSRARLIMIHLQTEGVKSRTVSLGRSLSAYLRSLGLPVSGGPRGSINAIREQSLRIARCGITMQWSNVETDGSQRTVISDTRIVDGLEFWHSAHGDEWSGTVELSERFQAHLKEHAVPLDKRGIAHLSGNSLGLDLYALLAYRLPRLSRDLHLRWSALQSQIGSNERADFSLAQRIREVMPDVLTAYPHANIDITPHGLLLKPSTPAVPKTMVRGCKLVDAVGG